MVVIRTSIIATLLLLLFSGTERLAQGQNNENRGIYLDRFTYKNRNQKNNVKVNGNDHTAIDYAPDNWGDISCNEGSKLSECLGYPDKWETGREWGISKNYCKSCPAGENNGCGRHHQSPVDLQRGVGLDFNVSSKYYSDIANECIVSILLWSIFVGIA